MTTNFDRAFEELIGHEGGLSMDPNDKGNWTGGQIGKGILKGSNFGISAASFPNEDIVNLTIERAKFLAKTRYWDRIRADEIEYEMAFQFFDAAYNHGPGNPTRWLQKVLGVAQDGDFGKISRGALAQADQVKTMVRFLSQRLFFFTDLSEWNTQGKGWARRIAGNMEKSVMDDRK